MRSGSASSGQISRISPSDNGSRSPAGGWVWGGGPASITPPGWITERARGGIRTPRRTGGRTPSRRGPCAARPRRRGCRRRPVPGFALSSSGMRASIRAIAARTCGMGLQRPEHPGVVGDAHGPQLRQSQPAQVVDVQRRRARGARSPAWVDEQAEMPELGRQPLAEAVAGADRQQGVGPVVLERC